MNFIFQKKSLIFSIIIFIISCLIFFFLYKIILNNEDMSKTKRDEWQTQLTQREQSKILMGSIKSIENEMTLLNDHFVKSSDIVPFLNTIEKIADDTGVKAEVLSVDIEKEEPSLSAQIKAYGTFEELYKLINLFENSKYNLKFISMNIKSLSTPGEENSKEELKPEWVGDFRIKLLSFVN